MQSVSEFTVAGSCPQSRVIGCLDSVGLSRDPEGRANRFWKAVKVHTTEVQASSLNVWLQTILTRKLAWGMTWLACVQMRFGGLHQHWFCGLLARRRRLGVPCFHRIFKSLAERKSRHRGSCDEYGRACTQSERERISDERVRMMRKTRVVRM